MRFQLPILLAAALFVASPARAQIDFAHVFETLTNVAPDGDNQQLADGAIAPAGLAQDEQDDSAREAEDLSILESDGEATDPAPLPPAPQPEADPFPYTPATPDPYPAQMVGSHGAVYGCSPWGHGGFVPQPLTVMQIFAPPCGTEGLWDTYPAEYYKRCEKRRAKRYPKHQQCTQGQCFNDGCQDNHSCADAQLSVPVIAR